MESRNRCNKLVRERTGLIMLKSDSTSLWVVNALMLHVKEGESTLFSNLEF